MAPSGDALKIGGNIPAVVTPFDRQGNLVIEDVARVIRWHLANGVDGICVAGDNGEAWALTQDERRQLADAAVKEAKAAGVPVVMGVSAITVRQTIALAEIAASAGIDALLVQPQAYVLKATTATILNRYGELARAVPLPIVAYNSPRRTGLNMDPATLAAVCDVAPIVALKEASRDFFHLTHIIERFGSRLAVLIGPAPFIVPGVALGARGFISSGTELLGPATRRIMELAATPAADESRRLHFTLTTIYETLMDVGIWPAALKAALNLLGVPAGVTREPVGSLAPEAATRLKSVMQELGLLNPS